MNRLELDRGDVDRHLRRMRVATVAFLLTAPCAAVAARLVSDRDSLASPLIVSLTAVGAALWVGFTANRDAETRLERIRRAFAVHGQPSRLLRDLRRVHVTVLARLEVMVIAAFVAAVWGANETVAWGILALAAVMMALAWPTAAKTMLLVERAREARGR